MDSEHIYKHGDHSSDNVSLKFYVGVLRRRKVPIVLFTSLITALAGLYAFTATPIYSAKSMLLIEDQAKSFVRFEELVGVDTESQDYYTTQFELLRSRGLAVRVMEQLDLWENPEFLSKREKDAVAIEVKDTFENALVTFKESTVVQSVLNLAGLGNTQLAGNDTVRPNETAQNLDDTGIESVNADGNTTALSNDELAQVAQLATTPSVFGIGDVPLNQERYRAVSIFMKQLSIEPITHTKLVEIDFKATDPELAAKVANAIGEQYIASFIDAKIALTERASSFLNERLTLLKQTLDESEARLQSFKKNNELVDVGGSVGRLNEQVLLLLSSELSDARSALTAKSNLYQEVRKLSGFPELLENLPAVQGDPLVQRVKIEQGQVEQILNGLQNRYGDRHPKIIDAMSQLETINLALRSHIQRVVGSISSDYELAQQRVASIERKLESSKRDIQGIGTKMIGLNELEREVATNRNIYNTFFSQIAEAKSSDGLEAANASVSDVALPPLKPISPIKPLIIGLAALVSLLMSFLVAVLSEQLSDTVKGTDDIEKKLGVKLLGILPLIKNREIKRNLDLPLNPLQVAETKGGFAEAVNTARTALSLKGSDCKVVMVTSSVPGEGKSTTAINLAYSLGRQQRVLLIDCDLRKPTVAKTAGYERTTLGLTNLITKTAAAKSCIKRKVFDGVLDILPSGSATDIPLELLTSHRFKSIVKELSRYYDRIILDCAPIQAVSDALALSEICDSVIYVVKSHSTSLDLVRRGLERLNQANASIAGVIVTQVDIRKLVTYGGDNDYQGYYAYYGNPDDELEIGLSSRSRIRLTQAALREIREDTSVVDLDLGRGHRPIHPRKNADDTADNDMDIDGKQTYGDELDLTARLKSGIK